MLSSFPRGVLDEILNLIESVSEDFPSFSLIVLTGMTKDDRGGVHFKIPLPFPSPYTMEILSLRKEIISLRALSLRKEIISLRAHFLV